MTEKNPPVGFELAEQAPPVHVLATGTDKMRDIRAVKALSLHNERFGPDHLFRWAVSDRRSENLAFRGMLKPCFVNLTDTVPRAEDHVHEECSFTNFGKPM